jgi:trans-aconitate methyltransferase
MTFGIWTNRKLWLKITAARFSSVFRLEACATTRVPGSAADLIIGNNVLAQVPDLNDFTTGMAHLLAPNGVVTLEVPHLERLIDDNQFDTIYHEHFSYFIADHNQSPRRKAWPQSF